jgi:hypothetical protein
VHSGGSGPAGFELKLATSTRSPITTELLPSGYFDPPARVVISATLGSTTTVLADGVIAQHDIVPSGDAGRSLLSIKGEDLTRMMDLVDLSGLPYPCLPAEARVGVMLAKYTALYGVVPVVVPSVLMHVPSPTEEVPQQRGTDLNYIKALADEAGYVFFVQPGPLPGASVAYWGPQVRAPVPFLPAPSPLAIDWDGSSNVESLQFSFDGFRKTLFVVLVQDEDTNVSIPIPVPDVTPLSPPLGARSPVPLKVSPLTGLAKYSPLQAAAIAMSRAADAAQVISASGTLDVMRYGAILNARTAIAVRGVGLSHDGDYFVDSVSHTIKPGSYKQSFTLTRNALMPIGSIAAMPGLAGAAQQLPAVATGRGPSGVGTLPPGAAAALADPSNPGPAFSALGSAPQLGERPTAPSAPGPALTPTGSLPGTPGRPDAALARGGAVIDSLPASSGT